MGLFSLTTQFEDQELGILYQDIFGKCTPTSLQNLLLQKLEPKIGKIKTCFFSSISIGAVFGVEAADGRKIVFKVYPKRFAKSELEKILFCQAQFCKENYPAPEVLSELIEIIPETYGSIQSYIDGERGDGHLPQVREALALGVAEFIRIAELKSFPEIDNPFQSKSRKRLWPIPHKSTIQLKESMRGAGFIRERALRAREIVFRHSLPKGLAHLDWGVKNARFNQRRLVAVFDWDSLGSMSEAEMVGQAAAQFTADWEINTKLTPDPEEACAFVEEYQKAKGKRFTKSEMQVVSAAADYLVSLIARYEYAQKVTSNNSFLYLVRSLGQKPLIQT